jgi:hypothetical protein
VAWVSSPNFSGPAGEPFVVGSSVVLYILALHLPNIAIALGSQINLPLVLRLSCFKVLFRRMYSLMLRKHLVKMIVPAGRIFSL